MKKLNCIIILMIASFFFSENLYSQDKWSGEDFLTAILNEDFILTTKLYDSDPRKFRVLADIGLVAAVEVGNVRIARYLLDKGADVNCVSIRDESPLNIAAEWADYKMIEFLCQKGAKDNPDGRLWGKSKTTLKALKLVFKMRDMSAATKERNGVTRIIRLDDIKRSLVIIDKYF